MNALNYRKVGLFMPNTVQTQEKKIQQIEQHIPLSNQTYPCNFFLPGQPESKDLGPY